MLLVDEAPQFRRGGHFIDVGLVGYDIAPCGELGRTELLLAASARANNAIHVPARRNPTY